MTFTRNGRVGSLTGGMNISPVVLPNLEQRKYKRTSLGLGVQLSGRHLPSKHKATPPPSKKRSGCPRLQSIPSFSFRCFGHLHRMEAMIFAGEGNDSNFMAFKILLMRLIWGTAEIQNERIEDSSKSFGESAIASISETCVPFSEICEHLVTQEGVHSLIFLFPKPKIVQVLCF